MSIKRTPSLYYGSVTIGVSLQFILAWIVSLFRSGQRRRDALHAFIQRQYFPQASGIFSFASARCSITAFLKAVEIGPGDEVILSAYTCLAVPTGIIAAGATPVYVDIDPETLNITADTVEKGLSPKVKAIIVQHTLGKAAPVQAIIGLAKERGILVIEDCALSIGSRVDEKYFGSFGDAAIFSMELSKTLSIGWGGILVVNNVASAQAVARTFNDLPEHSWVFSTRDLWQTVISSFSYHPVIYQNIGKYILFIGFKIGLFRRSTPDNEFKGIVDPGFVVKMSKIHVELAIIQWKRFQKLQGICTNNASYISNRLKELNIILVGAHGENDTKVAPRVSFLIEQRPLAVNYFQSRGMELGQWFSGPLSPVPDNPAFNYVPGSYPLAETVARRIVNFPCHSRISKKDIEYMFEILVAFDIAQPGLIVKHREIR